MNNIPAGWRIKKFEDITELITCGLAATPKYVDREDGIPFLSAQNVQGGKLDLSKYSYISRVFHKELTKKNKPQKGDILYSRVGAGYGEAAMVDIDVDFSIYVSLTLIKVKKEYDTFFIKHLLNSPICKKQAKVGVFVGGGVPNLNVNIVRKFDMPIPPIAEQKRIVNILGIWDRAIDTQNNLINAKEKFKEGLMEKLLLGKDRLKGFNSKWEVKRLEEMGTFMKGKGLSKSDVQLLGKKRAIPYTAIYTDFNEVIHHEQVKTFTSSKEIFLIKSPHILIAGSSNMLENIGKVTAYNDNVEVAIGGDIILYKTNCDVRFISYLLNTPLHRKKIISLSQGSTIRHVYPSTFLNYEIKVPAVSEQSAIADIFTTVDKDISLLRRKLDLLNNQKRSLMQNLLTGKVRVKV